MAYRTLRKLYYGDEQIYADTYLSRFNSEDAVKIDFQISGKPAFFVENTEVLRLTREILRLDKAVSELCAKLPGIAKGQYSKKCLIDEIVLTNKIEGVHSSRRDIDEALDTLEKQSAEKGKQTRFSCLVNMYLMLTQNRMLQLKTCQDIRNVYDKALLQEIIEEEPKHVPDGKIFRKDVTTIYSVTGKAIHQGLSPESNIIDAMEKALAFLNDESVDALYRICIFHYLLEYIHPFYDGNGRLGRLILSFGLSEQLEPLVGFRISETIRENLKAYYEAFETCNDSHNLGDLTPFLLMQLSMIRDALMELHSSLQRRWVSWVKYEKLIATFPIPEDKKGVNIKQMYSLLIQAALFSENGISTKELEGFFNSYHNVKKILEEIPQSHIVSRKKKQEKLYLINLQTLDDMLLEESLQEIGEINSSNYRQ